MPLYRLGSNEPEAAVLLRQLGDLAQLAAEVFDGLHDQVMAASARGRRLAARAQQLEAGLVDQHFVLCQTSQRQQRCLSNTGRVDWHGDLKVGHGTVAGGGGGSRPRFIAECVKRCRGPPMLSLLDKYDAHGEGSCLKRYTDPSFFRTHSAKLEQGNLGADGYLKETMETRPKFQGTENSEPPKSAQNYSKSETDASGEVSLGFLSMLRQLKHRQTNRSVSQSRKPQLHQSDHSEVDISFTSSPDEIRGDTAASASTTTEKAKENHNQGTVQFHDSPMRYCSDAEYGEQCCELVGKTCSFGAWLYPDSSRFAPKHGIAEEPSRKLVSPSKKSCACMVDGPLHLHEPTTSLPENSCSEDIKAAMPPPLPPIPPMQWLSVKVQESFRKYPVQVSEDKPKTEECSEFTAHLDEARSELAETNLQPQADTRLQQELRHRFGTGHSDCKDMHVPDSSIEKPSEEHEVFCHEGAKVSAAHGNMLPISKVNKTTDATQDDMPERRTNEECTSNLLQENVFFSAVQQLAKMSPPSLPRPKYSLLEIASHDRITLRNGPSSIHPSRNLLGNRRILLQQMKDKSFSLKPSHGRSSDALGSPTNSRVATILQRADGILQAHADDKDVGSEDSWSDSD